MIHEEKMGKLTGIYNELEEEKENTRIAEAKLKSKSPTFGHKDRGPNFAERLKASEGYKPVSDIAGNLVSYARKEDPAMVRMPLETPSQSFTSRFQERQQIKKMARNLKIKKIVVACSIAIVGTLVGNVVFEAQNLFINNTPAMEEVETTINNNIPTEAEYKAGLTPEQIQQKQALDAQLAEESTNSIGRSK